MAARANDRELACPVPWCQAAVCSLPARRVIAAQEEVPPGCANSVAPSRGELSRFDVEDAAITAPARQVLALCGSSDLRTMLASLAEGRLVFLEPRTPRPLRSTPPIRRRPEPAPEAPDGRAADKTAWIRLRVVDDFSGEPLRGVEIDVTTPNGKTFPYTTRPDGLVDVQEIDPGLCSVSCGLDEARLRDTFGFVTIADRRSAISRRENEVEEFDVDSVAGPSPRSISGVRIATVEAHKVRTGESIKSLAEANGLTWQQLAIFNWNTDVPDEINLHLRDDVGCTQKAHDGVNYRFDDRDDPGVVYIPTKWSAAGLATGQTHTIRVRSYARSRSNIAYIRLRVWDEDEQPITNAECTISDLAGGEIFAGATDANGCIRRDDVPFDDFRLEIEGFERIIPSVRYDDEWIDVFIPPRGYLRLLVHCPRQEPLCGAAFTISDSQGRKLVEGTTDTRGQIARNRVKLDDYRLTIGEFTRMIPAVAFGDEWIDVFTEPATSGVSPGLRNTESPTTDATSAGV